MPAPQRAFPHAGLLAGGEGEEERDGVRRNYARHSGAIPMRAGIESLVSVQRLHAKDAFKPALGFSPGKPRRSSPGVVAKDAFKPALGFSPGMATATA